MLRRLGGDSRVDAEVGPPGEAPLVIEPGAVTVVVGPNKAGKTTLLKEIEQWVKSGSRLRLLRAGRFHLPSEPKARWLFTGALWGAGLESIHGAFAALGDLERSGRPSDNGLRSLARREGCTNVWSLSSSRLREWLLGKDYEQEQLDASAMGLNIARVISDRKGQGYVGTHSEHVLMG